MVPADHEALGQHMQRRLQETQHVATRNSREEIGLANQVTSTTEHGHGARSRERHADVGLKPLETRPHLVSGARRVAGRVPRTGEQAHGLQNNSVPSTRSKWREEKLCGKSTSEHTHTHTHTECGDERSSEATASSHVQRLDKKSRANPATRRWKSIQPSARRRCQAQRYAKRASGRNSTCGDAAERRWTEPR